MSNSENEENKMHKITSTQIVILTALAALIIIGCSRKAHKTEFPDKLAIIEEIINEDSVVLDGTPLYNPDIITQLYEKSKNLLSEVWERKANIDQMLYAIRNVTMDGLHPEDYHLSTIEKLAQKIISSDQVNVEDIAKLELLLTDSFVLLSAHLANGKTNMETIDPRWWAARRAVNNDLQKFINSSLKSNRIIEGLQTITPKHREYNNLRVALLKYRQISQNGGWEPFQSTLPKLEIGMRHPDVILLRNRLAITQGYIELDSLDAELFDSTLNKQVTLFQKRNGLTPDGVVGKSTIEAMNIPAEERIASMEASLERWRWISDDLGIRYIKVNIANFELQVVENDSIVFITEAIVGRTYRETPVFSSTMAYMVLNPDWTVPPTILNDDIIPSVIKNPDYLMKKNLKVINKIGMEVDPSTIDWSSIGTNGFPYKVKQNPGADNALGRVKFMFPNKYSVYIHDTPNHSLFGLTDRPFSSGCIRINHPMELAAWLLKDKPEWTPAELESIIKQRKERSVKISEPIQVHILYLTSWASDDGTVYFRKDVYNRDQPLLAALKQRPSEPDQ